jgi:uncharacterized protein (DUF1330 family)
MLYVLAKLYVRPGAHAEFRTYERKALELFRRHGGQLVAAFSPEPGPEGVDWPDEIHVLNITDRTHFEDFLADPDRQALAGERDAVLRHSETFISRTIIPY